jgi:hypothetical protein
MKKLLAACLAASLALVAPAFAQGPPHHPPGGPPPGHSPPAPPPHHDFHGDPGHWSGGSWYHGNHGGVYGWWWALDGAYYPYAAPPADPYYDPNYYGGYASPPYADDPGYGNGYPPQPYAQQPYPPQPYAGGTWYYCANPPGYYPYVGQCTLPWQSVTAQPQ